MLTCYLFCSCQYILPGICDMIFTIFQYIYSYICPLAIAMLLYICKYYIPLQVSVLGNSVFMYLCIFQKVHDVFLYPRGITCTYIYLDTIYFCAYSSCPHLPIRDRKVRSGNIVLFLLLLLWRTLAHTLVVCFENIVASYVLIGFYLCSVQIGAGDPMLAFYLLRILSISVALLSTQVVPFSGRTFRILQ